MKTTRTDKTQTEPVFDALVASCNQIQSALYQASVSPVSRQENGPLRWRESCDKMIAVARDVLQFRLILETTSQADDEDVFSVSVTRHLPSNLMFHNIESIFIDGEIAKPTNHSLHRRIDLEFAQVRAGSIVVITYQARVDFNAETARVVVGDTDIRWSWMSRTKRYHTDAAHSSIPRVVPSQRVETACRE